MALSHHRRVFYFRTVKEVTPHLAFSQFLMLNVELASELSAESFSSELVRTLTGFSGLWGKRTKASMTGLVGEEEEVPTFNSWRGLLQGAAAEVKLVSSLPQFTPTCRIDAFEGFSPLKNRFGPAWTTSRETASEAFSFSREEGGFSSIWGFLGSVIATF